MAEANIPYTFTNGVGNTIDATEVNANFQNLEDAVNDIDTTQFSSTLAKYFPTTVVTSLPGTPIDGQTVLYQGAGMATDGIVWMLRYNSSSASSYKWEFIGGAALANDVDTAGSDPDGTPTLTVPLAGNYDVEFGSRVQVTNSGGTPPTAGMYIEVDGVFSDTLQVVLANTAGTTSTVGNIWSRTRAELDDGDVLVAKYGTSGGSGTVSFSNRRLSIVPVQVG